MKTTALLSMLSTSALALGSAVLIVLGQSATTSTAAFVPHVAVNGDPAREEARHR